MQRLSKPKKLLLAAGAGLTIPALLLAHASSAGRAHLWAASGTKVSVRDAGRHGDDDDRPPPVRDLTVPKSWAGQWQVTTAYHDALTGNLVATDEGTDTICPRDEVGLSSFVARPRHDEDDHDDREGRNRGDDDDGDDRDSDDDDAGDQGRDGLSARCTGRTTDKRLKVDCSSRFSFGGCAVGFRLTLLAERRAEQFAGRGEWRVVETAGACSVLPGQGETFLISGTRVSRDLGGCSAAPTTLIEKFVQHPELILALPAPIADLSAQGRHRQVELSWTAPPGASAYRIFRAAGNQPFELIAVRRAGAGAAFRDRHLTNGAGYRYVVRWLDAQGRQSPNSNEAAATPEGRND